MGDSELISVILRTMHLSDDCGRALKGHFSVAPWVVLTIHAWGVTDNVLTIHGNGPTHTDHASHPIPASRHCGVSVTYFDLFCVFNVYLCGPSLACLGGAKLFKIFSVYLCEPSLACLAGSLLLVFLWFFAFPFTYF